MRMLRSSACLQNAVALALFGALALASGNAQSGAKSVSGVASVAIAPAAAPENTPHWPANEAPKPAVVQWDSRGLSIQAENSSLKEILNEIAEKTGAKLDGVVLEGGAAQRVFGEYGPGTAASVLAQLLNGSGYNVMLVGDQGQGTPREIVLSKPSAASNEPPPPQQNSEEEEEEYEQEQPVAQPLEPQQPVTRWRRMQEMQQRQPQQQQPLNNTQQQY